MTEKRFGNTQKISLRHDIKLTDVTTNETFSDKLRMVCLQLPLAVAEPLKGETKLESWMYNLKKHGSNAATDKHRGYANLQEIGTGCRISSAVA